MGTHEVSVVTPSSSSSSGFPMFFGKGLLFLFSLSFSSEDDSSLCIHLLRDKLHLLTTKAGTAFMYDHVKIR